jgi:putative endonuclease
MATHARELGADGEILVANYLKSQGAEIVARNWRIKDGEIDLVARLNGLLLFVEVKSRTSHAFGHPLEAIDRKKAHRLQKLALAWIATHDAWGSDYRIDAAAVDYRNGLKPNIDYRVGVL